MKIPQKIKIGGHWFDIDISEDKMTGDATGISRHWKNHIWVNKDLVESKQMSVFIHEIIHAIEWMNHLQLTENQVATLAEGLHQVLIDNKLLKE